MVVPGATCTEWYTLPTFGGAATADPAPANARLRTAVTTNLLAIAPILSPPQSGGKPPAEAGLSAAATAAGSGRPASRAPGRRRARPSRAPPRGRRGAGRRS